MKLEITMAEAEALEQAIKSACPDVDNGSDHTAMLYALHDKLKIAVGLAPPPAPSPDVEARVLAMAATLQDYAFGSGPGDFAKLTEAAEIAGSDSYSWQKHGEILRRARVLYHLAHGTNTIHTEQGHGA